MLYLKNDRLIIAYDTENNNQFSAYRKKWIGKVVKSMPKLKKEDFVIELDDSITKSCEGNGTNSLYQFSNCYIIQKRQYSCRDQFHRYFTKRHKVFYFVVGINDSFQKINNLVKFIHDFEENLGLQVKTKFEKSLHSNVVKIIPSLFWIEFYLRFSLFTILVRHGQSYGIENISFNEFLQKDSYLKSTWRALEIFMKEKRKFKESIWAGSEHLHNGWQSKLHLVKNHKLLIK